MSYIIAVLCFIRRDEEVDNSVRKYCRWQCISFGINLAVTTTVLNMTSYYKVIELKDLPFSASTLLGLTPTPQNVMGWGSLSVITIAVLVSAISGILAYGECTCCHNMQAKSDATFQHAKDSLKCLAICIEDDNEEPGHEHEMTSLTGGIGAITEASIHVLQVQTPVIDLEIFYGFGDNIFEQQDDCRSDTWDIGDEGMSSDSYGVDPEIFTGVGDNQDGDQYKVDDELLHGVGDPDMSPTLDKIIKVFKFNNT